jgi:hypothetical protein
MTNLTLQPLIENVYKGLNNPDCSIFVGGVGGVGYLISNMVKIYFLYLIFQLLTKLIFKGIPALYEEYKLKKALNRFAKTREDLNE